MSLATKNIVFWAFVLAALPIANAAEPSGYVNDLLDQWDRRRAEVQTAVYTAVVQASADLPTLPSEKIAQRNRIAAWMSFSSGKYRFDSTAEDSGAQKVFILNDDGFYTCARNEAVWEVEAAKAITMDSEWLGQYPFLLAHGVVPLPPFEAWADRRRRLKNAVVSHDDVKTTFSFGDTEQVTVILIPDSKGLVREFTVAVDGREVLSITNKYHASGGIDRLSEFKVVVRSARGDVTRELAGRVEEFRSGESVPDSLFARPRSSQEVRSVLRNRLSKAVDVELAMSLDEFAASLRRALGDDLRVHVDREAFLKAKEVRVGELLFEPGSATLSDLLLRDFPSNYLDFYFDLQGIVVTSRGEGWRRAELVEYSAIEYGLDGESLREAIRGAVRSKEDWSELGGPASILVDEVSGSAFVFHAQSDHFRIESRLVKSRPVE